MKILHITESFGGGVATALQSYARNTPDLSHHLLARKRAQDLSNHIDLAMFDSVRELPLGIVDAIRTIRHSVIDHDPDIIHLHSSYAGAFGRIGLLNKKSRPIIYTPHGFSFERKDLPAPLRATYYFAEYILSLNTTEIAACSPRENNLSRIFPTKNSYVPNAQPIEHGIASNKSITPDNSIHLINIIGRITAARNHTLVCDLAKHFQDEQDVEVKIRWIGDGDTPGRRQLEMAGIEVTGWLSEDQLRTMVSESSLLVHPSNWDGFPMSIIESVNYGVPALVSDVPAFYHLDDIVKFGDSAECYSLIKKYLTDGEFKSQIKNYWRSYIQEHSPHNQTQALYRVYRAKTSI